MISLVEACLSGGLRVRDPGDAELLPWPDPSQNVFRLTPTLTPQTRPATAARIHMILCPNKGFT